MQPLAPTEIPGNATIDTIHDGLVLYSSSATTTTWTLSAAAVPGTEVGWVQDNAGTIVFSAAAGATLECVLTGHNSSAGQNARGSLIVMHNSGGAAAVWNLAGFTTVT
ncbi:hypothetical protein [Labrys wisconsinensis]|uniref:Uncharacterized protein n=1 Tax=Labrys wisconsinensis TaxID=425677 RepID=A0ABU0JJW4_9HYPH|nr:hypothetical protein [Labrys wisconsinensis]MDQ0474573.1 hypothetical protein [Labrys wisconsinensis]